MSQVLSLQTARIRLTRAGTYSLLFALGLLLSSAYTGTNLLFLMDFILFSGVLISLMSAVMTRKGRLFLNFSPRTSEESSLPVQLKCEGLGPCQGMLEFGFRRFGEEGRQRLRFFWDGERLTLDSDPIWIRGEYRIYEVKARISVAFRLVELRADLLLDARYLVWPRPDGTTIPAYVKGGLGSSQEELRAYQPTDGLGRIHWKRYARDGELYIRSKTSPGLSRIFKVEYDSVNEREVLRGLASFFLARIQAGEPFEIGCKDRILHSGSLRKEELMDFLASCRR